MQNYDKVIESFLAGKVGPFVYSQHVINTIWRLTLRVNGVTGIEIFVRIHCICPNCLFDWILYVPSTIFQL